MSYAVKTKFHPGRWETVSYLTAAETALKHFDSLILSGREAALFHGRRRLREVDLGKLRQLVESGAGEEPRG